MAVNGIMRQVALAIALGILPAAVFAQASPGDTKAAKKCKAKDTSCSPGPAAESASQPKSMHEEFPFPTEDSKRGAEGDAGASSSSSSAPSSKGMPEMPTSGVPDPPADSEKPLNLPPDSSGSLPPGTSSSSSDDDSDVAPTTAGPNAPVKSAPLKNYGAHDSDEAIRARLDKTRLPDDLKVGKYYLQSGNPQGAYLRFKDATELDTEDPDARFFLGEAAARLNKRDEAVAAYRACLKLDPGGDHDKAARKALEKLGATAAN